jgi:hypothetical protein
MALTMTKLKELTIESKAELNSYLDFVLTCRLTHNERVTVLNMQNKMNANMDSILYLIEGYS